MSYPTISRIRHIQAHYELCREKGTSHELAEMFALAQPPMSNTDREFLEGHCNGNQFSSDPDAGDLYAKRALAAGVDPKGKVYISGLARFPGDPMAWISGRGDARRICEENGWGCSGVVDVPVRRVAERTDGGIASGIIDNMVLDHVESLPEGEKVDVEGLRHELVDKHAPYWAKREVKEEG